MDTLLQLGNEVYTEQEVQEIWDHLYTEVCRDGMIEVIILYFLYNCALDNNIIMFIILELELLQVVCVSRKGECSIMPSSYYHSYIHTYIQNSALCYWAICYIYA